MNSVVGLFPISLENVPTVHGADLLASVRLRNWTRYPGWSDPQKRELKTWKGCNAWYLLTSPSEALRGHGWIGLLAGRDNLTPSHPPGRTVASLWILFLLTVARAASDFHRSSRSSNHDELIKCQGHHRQAKRGCQVYGLSRNSGTGPEFFSKVLVFLENSWGCPRILTTVGGSICAGLL